jgi:hypothetical protein
MTENLTPQAISEITDPDEIRVLIFINNQQIHVPLNALVKHLQDQIDALDARIDVLETP